MKRNAVGHSLQSLIFFVIFCHLFALSQHISPTTYYENIINQQIDDQIHFEPPIDASRYKPTNEDNVEDFGYFDFVIIGASAAGSVIANRLSAIQKWKILLLEAGSFGNQTSDIPALAPSLKATKFNWNYQSTVQTTSCLDMKNQKCLYPRGQGIGGSSLINNLVYSRGCKKDYDKWSENNPGWSYEEVLPYFKKSEHLDVTDPDAAIDRDYHGTSGELNVAFGLPRTAEVTRWFRANEEKGYKIIDYNGKESIGACVAQFNTKNGRRHDDGTAFIKPVKTRSNLHVSTNSFATKIIVNNKTKTATGVEFTLNGQKYIARVKTEVILSAGTISSPQLLMLSGIGPAKHLQEKRIPVILDLEVGTTLRDHPMYFGLNFKTNSTKKENSLREYVGQFLQAKGPLTVPVEIHGMGFYQTKFEKGPNYPDLQIIVAATDGFSDYLHKQLPTDAGNMWLHLKESHAFSVKIIGLHSKSIGSVRLKTNSPYDYPLIDSKFLSDLENRDLGTLYEGIELGLSFMNTTAFQEINATLVRQSLPACDDKPYLSDSYWYCAIRHFSSNCYHPMGTCPMGPDPSAGAVVDAQAKVHGMKKLRVVDASIIPLPVSGPTNAPCVMIGEKVSDLIIRGHRQRKPSK